MGKKDDSKELDREVVELLADIGDDRSRLTDYLDKLLKHYDDSDSLAGIGEIVAKLIDSSTKQLQVRAGVVKVLAKKIDSTDDTSEEDELAAEIGMPFASEETEHGN